MMDAVAAAAEEDAAEEKDASAEEDASEQATEKTVEQKKRLSRREQRKTATSRGEEYVGFGADQFEVMKDCYGMAPEFSSAQLITRSDESKSITFVTKSITMQLLEEMKAKKFKVIYTGIKMFERTDLPDGSKTYRLCQSGLPMALPFVSKRKITISLRDLQMLLHRHGDLLDFDEFDAPTREALEQSSMGTVICCLDRPEQTVLEYVTEEWLPCVLMSLTSSVFTGKWC
ncbi:hypothetical protein ATCC90586_010838 [Pythium insidiosum]|nr:hypothetical protein ATCC90586_010838 [Pythium insidiosum]